MTDCPPPREQAGQRHDRIFEPNRLSRRTYSPVLRQASLPETITVPWWGARTLRYQYD
jgi:hypothetical protein